MKRVPGLCVGTYVARKWLAFDIAGTACDKTKEACPVFRNIREQISDATANHIKANG